ncbi:MAG: NYN domain-containing protein [Chloroflexi bacterium]|nr:NYN domain-containing protein [Chloroflexota bacterium]
MPQIAVFVDAGYLYAQGSALLKGRKLGREWIRLSEKAALDQLAKTACAVASGCRLLRIYWYDGVLRSNRPSIEQDLIGQSANTKLRLGLVNSRGQQKGVDSLIVTDLIELARNRAITDALILCGDEDIKIGVQVAQTFGVRVHLLGIKPAKGSQSDNLMMEADTCHEWNEAIVSTWMHCDDVATDLPVRPPAGVPETHNTSAADEPPSANGSLATPENFREIVAVEVTNTIEALSASDLERHAQFLDANPGRIHSDIDRRTLAGLRNRLDRDLTDSERKEYRQAFAVALRRAQTDEHLPQ